MISTGRKNHLKVMFESSACVWVRALLWCENITNHPTKQVKQTGPGLGGFCPAETMRFRHWVSSIHRAAELLQSV
jgi:hypothetical protein